MRSKKYKKIMSSTSWRHRRTEEAHERNLRTEPLTAKEQEYANMIAGTDPFNVHNIKNSKHEKHLRYIINSLENGDTVEEIADVLDADASYLRKYLSKRMGQNWYDHRVNCHKRKGIMRATYKERIVELRTKGYSFAIIAKRLELTTSKVRSWHRYYEKNP